MLIHRGEHCYCGLNGGNGFSGTCPCLLCSSIPCSPLRIQTLKTNLGHSGDIYIYATFHFGWGQNLLLCLENLQSCIKLSASFLSAAFKTIVYYCIMIVLLLYYYCINIVLGAVHLICKASRGRFSYTTLHCVSFRFRKQENTASG